MEIIRAIISIFLGLMFLSLMLRLAFPLLIVVGVFILFLVIRVTLMNRQYKKHADTNQEQYSDGRQRTSRTRSPSDNDENVIDAEYTEEELD